MTVIIILIQQFNIRVCVYLNFLHDDLITDFFQNRYYWSEPRNDSNANDV